MKIGFIISQMTYLKYYMPLIIRANDFGIKSVLYMSHLSSGKYCGLKKHAKNLKKLSEKYSCGLKGVSEIDDSCSVFFVMEGVGIKYVPQKAKKISMTYITDFTVHYDKYIDKVDGVIFPSEFLPKHYGKFSDKNMYLGCSKYDVEFDKEEIKEKYSIKDRSALILYPSMGHLNSKYGVHKFKFKKFYKHLHKMGYNVIVKARGKNPAPPNERGDLYIQDGSWFPHDTMELMSVCDFSVGFDTGGAKESIMISKPFVNLKVIRKYDTFFPFFYDDKCSLSLDCRMPFEEIESRINGALKCNESDFVNLRDYCLFNEKDSSYRILKEVCGV